VPLIAWTVQMELGLPTIDHEHRHWVEIINQLHAALMADADSVSAATFVAQMQAYAAEHFPSEEQLMVAHGYPGLARHRQLHREFAAQVGELQEQIATGHVVLKTSLMSMMKEWLENHIHSEDRRFADFVLGGASQPRH
jgi:hemerythrin